MDPTLDSKIFSNLHNNSTKSFDSYENEDEYESDNENQASDKGLFEDQKSNLPELKQELKRSFDYFHVDEYAEAEEEEEEELLDYADDDFSPTKYDLTRFRYDALNDDERKEIIDNIKELREESNVLLVKNKFLQKKYINVIQNSSSYANALDKFDESLIFENDRYRSTLENYAQTRDDVDGRRQSLSQELQNLEENYAIGELSYQELFNDLVSRQLALAKKIKPAKSDKQEWLNEVDRMLESQKSRIMDVAKIRLTYLHLNYRLKKLKAALGEFDCLGVGFSMMDYEYLLKRKSVYRDRKDEQFEQIKKLSEKNLSSAAIIKHVDEETDLYNEIVKNKTDKLNALSSKNQLEYSKSVDLVKERALIFKSTLKLREEIGLLNNIDLVRKMKADLLEIAELNKRTDYIRSKMFSDRAKVLKKHEKS